MDGGTQSRRRRSVACLPFLAALAFTPLSSFDAAAQSVAVHTASLTATVAEAAANAASSGGTAEQAQPATNPDAGVLGFFRNTELGGLVDVYYDYNFNKTAGDAPLRNFDTKHNQFAFSMAEVWLSKTPTADSRAGFNIKLNFGPATSIIHSYEPGGAEIFKNIQQGYLSYLAPAGKGLQIDFGKFVTQHGAEVIEAKDNWNYSRSLLFALAIPYYHMGVRMAYSPNDKVTLGANISNGWNNVVENNTGKTAGFMGIFKPTAALSWTVNYMVGPEQAEGNDGVRHLFDTTLAYTASPMVSLMLNYDMGKDTIGGQSVKWQGVGGYAKLTPNSWFALVPRVEFLKDGDGFMTGASQNVKEFTLTAELKHKDGVMMRIEYRGDFAGVDYFIKNTSESSKNQNAFILGWVYTFSTKTP